MLIKIGGEPLLSSCAVVLCLFLLPIHTLTWLTLSRELFGFWREHNQRANFSKHHFPFKCFQFNDTFIRRLAQLWKSVCVCVRTSTNKQPRSLTGEF